MYTGTYERLGLSIWATDREIIRAGARKLHKRAFTYAKRQARHAFYRELIAAHRAAQDLAWYFRL